ncbi:amino acid permease [Maribacter polysaccharolyticus]|uniref:amino acid permease n=1 Tax=Maribacter polysaccharolyticus TaxID=3020831 RepID=UPI00237FCE9B|nr:amino acid permease [Maribacter polysaccharolyticus]MDE3741710.1 amino acid permease [Maribacter polysaccharolyticus]
MQQNFVNKVQTFGTAPVFFTAIATILGAIMFLRFGFAVGQVGFLGAIAIILIGHAVTIPTAMAIAEIATNQKVEGGGEYYIISRSFGLVIGSTIGIALYMSQAISVAFYVMAFSEALTSFFDWLISVISMPDWLQWILRQKQTVGIPGLLVLTYIMLTKGANLGVKLLYTVVAVLALSLFAFFMGTTEYSKTRDFDPIGTIADVMERPEDPTAHFPALENNADYRQDSLTSGEITINDKRPDMGQARENETKDDSGLPEAIGFFIVFSIIFPAFTGMTAGVGLSGDLKNPGKSIPLGTLAATLCGMLMYFLIAWKLAVSAPPEALADTSRLIMADIAWQGWWIIPIGLAAATISSALGSIMVAPRTLQAIARDGIFPAPKINNWLSKGKGNKDEPYNASVITIIIAGLFILMGALDSVAQIISMFFMVTYGSLCLISFLNHFAADPSYRPKFKSRWYVSLFGALSCFALMFFMNTAYALLAVVLILVLFAFVAYFNQDKRNLAVIFQGVIFQLSRQMQVFLQKTDKEQSQSWRPSTVAISEDSFKRFSAFQLLRWIAHRYGFGTYIHYIKGYLSKETNQEAIRCKDQLIAMADESGSNVFVDTLVSPSFTSTVAQIIQLPGIAGKENNLLLFEYHKNHPDNLLDIVDNLGLIKSVNFDLIILASSERGFGLKKQIHLWICPYDFENANLMILLAYILLGHPDWKAATINIHAIFPEESINEERERLFLLIQTGQLPISPKNIEFIAQKSDKSIKQIINEKSKDADLTIVGFIEKAVEHLGMKAFEGYQDIGNVLFVNAAESKEIK